MATVTLAMIARIRPEGLADFAAYEDLVLPLLADHGGRLERRLRSKDGTVEVHVVSFGSRDGLDRYRGDPRRAAAGRLLASSGATTEVIEVDDLATIAGRE